MRIRIPPAKRTSARVLAAKLAKLPELAPDPALRASDHDDFLIDFDVDWYRVSVETYHSTFKPWIEKRKAVRAGIEEAKALHQDAAALAAPPFSYFNCGTHYIRAQATLALLDQMSSPLAAHRIDREMIEQIEQLVEQSGAAWAAMIAKAFWDRRGNHLVDEVPF